MIFLWHLWKHTEYNECDLDHSKVEIIENVLALVYVQVCTHAYVSKVWQWKREMMFVWNHVWIFRAECARVWCSYVTMSNVACYPWWSVFPYSIGVHVHTFTNVCIRIHQLFLFSQINPVFVSPLTKCLIKGLFSWKSPKRIRLGGCQFLKNSEFVVCPSKNVSWAKAMVPVGTQIVLAWSVVTLTGR